MSLPSKLSPTLHSGVIVLTGGIASGKSTAARMFRDLGAAVVDADEIAREVVQPGSPGLAAVIQEFGAHFLATDGRLDRSALGRLVFSDQQKRQRLEAILHPLIRLRADECFADSISAGAPLVVYDCPLYFEGDLTRLGFRGVIVVWAPAAVCIDRLVRRAAEKGEQLSVEQAKERLGSQLSLDEKKQKADWVIDNSGPVESLRQQVAALYQMLAKPGGMRK